MSTENETIEHGAANRIEEEESLARDPAWRAALSRAVTTAVMENVRTYARMLLGFGAAAYCDETPGELADAALSDTALGRGRWDPARGDLAGFLRARVKYGLARRADDAARMVRIDIVEEADPEAAALDRALASAPTPVQYLATRAAMVETLRIIRERFADDAMALAYLDARLAGHASQRTAAAAMGETFDTVRAAHRRVVRLVQTLPVDLLDHVAALLA